MAQRVCPNCFERTKKTVCPKCGVSTVRDHTQTGLFKRLFTKIGIGRFQEPEDLTGKTIEGRYRVTELIGHGGMGEVYRAVQVSTLQDVALKVIKADLATDPDAIRRFFREARSAATINHPNVVRVWEFGQLRDGRLFLAMEFLQGRSLADIIKAERKKGEFRGFDAAKIVEIGMQVASALQAAHSKGVVHRDLKPGNIILLDDGDFVKVVDFGISKFVGGEAASITRTDLFIGTPAYASPEQASAGVEIDGRSDLYSLGVVLFEMATGHVPFHGIDNPVAQLAARLNSDAPPLRSLVSADRIPDDLCAVVDKLLKRRREERYSTAAEVLEDLAKIASRLGLLSKTPARGFLPALLTPPATPTRLTGSAQRQRPIEEEEAIPTLPSVPRPATPTTGPSTPVPGPATRQVPWIAILALTLAAASAGGMFYILSRAHEGLPQNPQTPAASTLPPEPEKPAQILPPPVKEEPKEARRTCRLSIESRPEGAAILIGDVPSGKTTPATLEFPCEEVPKEVKLVKEGYTPEVVALSTLGFPEVQAAAVAPSLKKVVRKAQGQQGCKSDADCKRGQYCSKGRCKDLF